MLGGVRGMNNPYSIFPNNIYYFILHFRNVFGIQEIDVDRIIWELTFKYRNSFHLSVAFFAR